MPQLDEVASAFLKPPLVEGIDLLSRAEEVTFYGFRRYVLPVDGYVFWVIESERKFKGSLHVNSSQRQAEDETMAMNQVVFTTGEEIQDFNAIASDQMWIGNYTLPRSSTPILFAFSERREFYRQAGLFHYIGMSVYPALMSQIILDPTQLASMSMIVSNSLPMWLYMASQYKPVDVAFPPTCPVTLFPSYAVPDNILPPYGVVHIEPSRTESLQMVPAYGSLMQHGQLAADWARITLYGLNNEQAMNFVDFFLEFSTNGNAFGLMCSPIMRDEKRTQSELNILAQKKTMDVRVSYNQGVVRNVARRLITSVATPTVVYNPGY